MLKKYFRSFLFPCGIAGALMFAESRGGETPAAAADEVSELTRGAVPAWVEVVPWEKSTDSRPGFPGEMLLSDAQGSLRDEGCDYFFHTVTRLLNREGVQQNAEQSVTFSPEYERVIWHTLRIHRGAEIFDQLSRVKFKRLQRELGLEGKVYDGRITAVAVLEDVRVGDLVEVAYTRLNTNPLLKGYHGFRMSLGSTYPIKCQSIIVRMPAVLPKPNWFFFLPPDTQGLPEPIFSAARMRKVFRDTSTDTEHIYRWEAADIAGVPFDRSISGEAAPYYPMIRCSAFSWWSHMVDWALPLFERGEALPAEQENLVAQWRKLPDERARLRAAVDWVQGDVRYFSMAFGDHNVKPRPIEDIAGTRFGDCKDKSVLLVRLLRELGFEAWPALVNSYSDHLVRQAGPDIHAFNHCIVAYQLDGQLRWVDPTIRQPAGRAGDWELPAAYSSALILRSGESRLTETPKPDLSIVDSETTDRIKIDGPTGAADIAMEVRLRGLQADFYRMSMEEVPDEQRAKGWFNYLARFYPRIEEVEPPKIEDDRQANALVFRARYRVPDAVRTEQGVKYANLHAYALRALVENPESRRRHWPLALHYGRSIRHRLEVDLPEDVLSFVRPTVVRTQEFEYRAEKTGLGKRVTAVHDLRFSARHVPPGRMAVFADSVVELLGEMTVGIRFNPAPPGEPPKESGQGAETLTSTRSTSHAR